MTGEPIEVLELVHLTIVRGRVLGVVGSVASPTMVRRLIRLIDHVGRQVLAGSIAAELRRKVLYAVDGLLVEVD